MTYSTIFGKKNQYFVGSASSALYIYLKHLNIYKSKVLCPSNICYSIPYTIEFTDNSLLFYDVLRKNGNPDIKSIRQQLKNNKEVSAIILPHMFGNLIENRDEIITLCLDYNVKIIEDLASSIGIDLSRNIAKSDAIIYSFGKNKPVDIGFGGVLATNEIINIEYYEKNIENDLSVHKEKTEIFDNIYKTILYSDFYKDLLPLIKGFNNFINDAFVYRVKWQKRDEENLIKKLENLDLVKNKNLKTISKIDSNINYNKKYLKKFNFNEGSNPWRYNILISDKTIRKRIIKEMLLYNLPISVWYPPIDLLFNQDLSINSKFFSEEIINLNISNIDKKDLFVFTEILNKTYKVHE